MVQILVHTLVYVIFYEYTKIKNFQNGGRLKFLMLNFTKIYRFLENSQWTNNFPFLMTNNIYFYSAKDNKVIDKITYDISR